MKIEITKESKSWMTVEENEIAKQIVKDFKENGETLKDEAQMLANFILGNGAETLKATAKIAGNQRIWNFYNEESGKLDIWLDVTAHGCNGMAIIGAYLSDIWRIEGDNKDEYLKDHMFIRMFVEQK